MIERDTIAAIATPAGFGGIGIVRVSGEKSLHIAKTLFRPLSNNFTDFRPWTLHRGLVHSLSGKNLDEALVVYMPGPKSYTGEDCVEFQCHGSMAILRAVLEAILQAGARLADRGEFTRRAYLNGRLDLSQAEAVAEVIHAPSLQGAQMALSKLQGLLSLRVQNLRAKLEDLRLYMTVSIDFPEEEVGPVENATLLKEAKELITSLDTLLASFERSKIWREGFTVALAGPVNAGKSSLLNAFLGQERAIVTSQPGTTRDFLEESLLLDGVPARIIDTAGLRELIQHEGTSHAEIELEGMRRGQEKAKEADVILLLVDGCEGMSDVVLSCAKSYSPQRIVLIWNKIDIAPPPSSWFSEQEPSVAARCAVSAQNGLGLEELASTIKRIAMENLSSQEPDTDNLVPNVRQAQMLAEARAALLLFEEAIIHNVSHDLATSHLDIASNALYTVTGLDTPDEVLNRIFDAFCIGK